MPHRIVLRANGVCHETSLLIARHFSSSDRVLPSAAYTRRFSLPYTTARRITGAERGCVRVTFR